MQLHLQNLHHHHLLDFPCWDFLGFLQPFQPLPNNSPKLRRDLLAVVWTLFQTELFFFQKLLAVLWRPLRVEEHWKLFWEQISFQFLCTEEGLLIISHISCQKTKKIGSNIAFHVCSQVAFWEEWHQSGCSLFGKLIAFWMFCIKNVWKSKFSHFSAWHRHTSFVQPFLSPTLGWWLSRCSWQVSEKNVVFLSSECIEKENRKEPQSFPKQVSCLERWGCKRCSCGLELFFFFCKN